VKSVVGYDLHGMSDRIRCNQRFSIRNSGKLAIDLLNLHGTVGAAVWVVPNNPTFVGAEAAVAVPASDIRRRRDLVSGVRVLAIDLGLGAVGDIEGVAELFSAG
jgi:hypothetical protein